MTTISVITICFNNLSELQSSCDAVDSQTRLPDEHWIINGSTTSEIADWLQTHPQPSHRFVLNERDAGISDAFNKGILRASGSVVHLLNSGDRYASTDVLQTVEQVFEANKDLQWISGKIRLVRAGLNVVVGKAFEKDKLYRGMRSVSHPTWFVKKELYNRVGQYSTAYKIAMDYDMMCRIAAERYHFVDKELAVFDDSGVSSTSYLRSLQENKKVYESHFGPSIKLTIWQMRLKLLYHLLQTGVGKSLFALKKKWGMENA